MTDGIYIEHDTDSRDCWCKPVLYSVCPECREGTAGCWRCEPGHPGLVLADPNSDEPVIIVHNDIRVPA